MDSPLIRIASCGTKNRKHERTEAEISRPLVPGMGQAQKPQDPIFPVMQPIASLIRASLPGKHSRISTSTSSICNAGCYKCVFKLR